ncbi:MAG: PIG-L family deacetylase [Planctomycetes bacterium]|nr:PIG-L family deacetylase [Planctomycetota bacterium]
MRLPADYDPAPPPDARCWSTPPRGRVLCFAPHPDDETIGPGGALALHRDQGDLVRVVFATDGSAGDPDALFPRDGYAERRRAEARAALAELGVTDCAFWGYRDACVVAPADLEAVARRAAEELSAFRPDVVYLPWPGERNGDHRALCAGVAAALGRAAFAGLALGYEVWTPLDPDVVLDVTSVVDRKRRALACHVTQLRYVDYQHVILGLNAYRSLMSGRGRGHWEAFVFVEVGAEEAR